MKHVTKTSGGIELYSADKLARGIQKSLHAVHAKKDEAESATEQVVNMVNAWLENKHEVTTKDIRTYAAKQLALLNSDAAMVYKKHKDMW